MRTQTASPFRSKPSYTVPRLLFSPASAFAFAFFGYYSFAGLTNAFLPNDSLGGILIRGGILFIILMALLNRGRRLPSKVKLALLPGGIFLFAYSWRVIENFYLADIYIPFNPSLVFLTFFLGIIFSALALSRIIYAIRDDQFVRITSFLCIMFLGGLLFNLNAIEQTSVSRLSLEKINPISIAYTATSFLIYYLLVFSKSKRLMIEAVIFVPFLLFVFVYARSMGAILSNAGALLIFLVLARGSRRLGLLFGLILLGLVMLYFLSGEYLDIITKSLDRLNRLDDQSRALHVLAWTGAWQQFLNNPIFGKYIIELVTQFYPHNAYLGSLMAVGIVGSIPFAVHILLATWAAAGIIRSKRFSTAELFIAIMYFRESISVAGAGSLWGATGYWITSILVIAIWYRRQERDSTMGRGERADYIALRSLA